MDELQTLRDRVVKTLREIGAAGALADAWLVKEEEDSVTRPTQPPPISEEQLQALGALSRQLWSAHSELQKAVRIIDKLRNMETQERSPGKRGSVSM